MDANQKIHGCWTCNSLVNSINGLNIVVVLCRWFFFLFNLFCECAIGHEPSVINVENLIKTNPLAQHGKDKGVNDQIAKVMDIKNIFKLQI